MKSYILEMAVNVKAGEPYLYLEYGDLYYKGEKEVFTPEIASKFKLPPWKPAIKIGSHDKDAPAAGHIVGFELRDDGLYVVPEFTDTGRGVLDRGDYRYHSPEVLFSKTKGIEDHKTGEMIYGPFILGDALLHAPHLGEAAALYHETIKEVNNMENEQVTVPVSWLDKIFKSKEPDKEPQVIQSDADVAKLEAVQAERDEYAARVAEMEAETAKGVQLTAIKAEFATEEFGTSYVELGKADENTAMLAGMTDEQRDWVVKNFKALSGQIKESAITGELGNEGDQVEFTSAGLDKRVSEYAAEHKVVYGDALAAIAKEDPEFVQKANKGGK